MQNFNETNWLNYLRSSFIPKQQSEIKRWAITRNLLKVEREDSIDGDKGKPEVILVVKKEVTWKTQNEIKLFLRVVL